MHFVRETANLQVLTCSTDYRRCRAIVRGSVGLEMVEDMAANTCFINVPMVKRPGNFHPLHPYDVAGLDMLTSELERLTTHWLAGGNRVACTPAPEPAAPAPTKLDDATQEWLDRQLAANRQRVGRRQACR